MELKEKSRVIKGMVANQPIEIVPACFEGEVYSLRILPKSGVTATVYCSIMTGTPGAYALLLAQCETDTNSTDPPKDVECLDSDVYGYEGIHIVPDGNIQQIVIGYKTLVA